MEKKPSICVVTYPRVVASIQPLSNLIGALVPLCERCFLITGNEGKQVLQKHPEITGYSLKYKTSSYILSKILGHILMQIKISSKMIQQNKSADLFVFYMSDGLLLPTLTAKLLNKRVVLIIAASASKLYARNRIFFTKLFIMEENINYHLADKLVIYSNKLIPEWGLEKFKEKILIAHEHYVDFDAFRKRKNKFRSRTKIGFIGRLSEEKGILQFIRAIPGIVKQHPGISFFIGGDGPLKDQITKYINDNNLQDNVELAGWIPHEKLPEIFPQLKLLVLPSYTEGLPNIMLEAMACGTPVLATPVGAIPDVINSGITGFILQNNSAECISETILRALNNPQLERIADNAAAFVEKEYTRQKSVELFDNVLKQSFQ